MAKGATRDLTKETFWRRMSTRQADSQLSIRAWCRKHDLNEATFHWWRRELARRDAEGKPSARRRVTKRSPLTGRSFVKGSKPFLPVHVTDDGPRAPDPPIEIVLTDGRRVRVHGSVDRQALTDVLAALEPRGC